MRWRRSRAFSRRHLDRRAGSDQSGVSHSLSLNDPLRLRESVRDVSP